MIQQTDCIRYNFKQLMNPLPCYYLWWTLQLMLAWKMSQETSHTKLSIQKVVIQLCTKLGSSCLKPTCSNAQSKLTPFPLNRLEATRNIVCIKLQLWKPSTRHRLSPWIGDLAGEGSLGSLIVDRYDMMIWRLSKTEVCIPWNMG